MKISSYITVTVIFVCLVLITYKNFGVPPETTIIIENLPQLTKRTDFGHLMEKHKFKTMIEIGVLRGAFADETLSRWPSFQHYYGIDTWRKQENLISITNDDDNSQNEKYLATKKLLSKYGENRITLIRDKSSNAVSMFSDYSIDFIYIDGRHDYCGALEDLNLYFPKLKCGGLMAGHDYRSAKGWPKGVDVSLCENGERVLTNGGSVKGFFNLNFFLI
jgi:hypothetical protein